MKPLLWTGGYGKQCSIFLFPLLKKTGVGGFDSIVIITTWVGENIVISVKDNGNDMT